MLILEGWFIVFSQNHFCDGGKKKSLYFCTLAAIIKQSANMDNQAPRIDTLWSSAMFLQ